MYIIQLQANTQNSRKTLVKRQIKCTINRTPKQRQERRGRSRHTLAHHSITTVKIQHFTIVKRHSVSASTHNSDIIIIHNYRKIFFKNMLTNNISSLYNRISSKVSTDEVTVEKTNPILYKPFFKNPPLPLTPYAH